MTRSGQFSMETTQSDQVIRKIYHSGHNQPCWMYEALRGTTYLTGISFGVLKLVINFSL